MKKFVKLLFKIGILIDLISGGIALFFAFRKKQVHDQRGLTQDIFILFGGKKERFPNKVLQSPMYSVYFGGLDIDLSDAEVEGDYLNIDMEVLFGGVNMIVPPHWNVTINNLGTIFGGINKDFESDLENAIVDVMINVRTTFGGVNIQKAVYATPEEAVVSDENVETIDSWEINERTEDFEFDSELDALNDDAIEENEENEEIEEVDEAVEEAIEIDEDDVIEDEEDDFNALESIEEQDALSDLKELDGIEEIDGIEEKDQNQ